MPHRTLAEQVRGGFPGALRAAEFVDRLAVACMDQGFEARSSLLIVGVCRDELCFPFVARLEDEWGPAFHIGSLGGLPTIGRTGIAAALGHAPESPGAPQRYLVVAAAHVGMDETGEFGFLRRDHQAAETNTCGALMALREDLVRGRADAGYRADDPEMSLLRQRLLPTVAEGPVPSIVELTTLLARLIDQDVHDLIRWRVQSHPGFHEVQVAVVTGVLVHTAGGDWVQPIRTRLWSSLTGSAELDLAPAEVTSPPVPDSGASAPAPGHPTSPPDPDAGASGATPSA